MLTSTIALFFSSALLPQSGNYSPEEVLSIAAPVSGGAFGASVCFVPDQDGDGKDEILVGATSDSAAGSKAGRVYMFSGADGSLMLDVLGPGPNQGFGEDVDTIGDLNGDGLDELLIGSQCKSWPSCPGSTSVKVLSGLTGEELIVTSGSGVDFYGVSVAGMPDINGDGISDYIVSASDDNCAGTDTGKIFAHSGLDGSVLHAVCGPVAWARFSLLGIDSLNDVDGDGVADWVGGAHESPGGDGRARVVSGASGTILYDYNPNGTSNLGWSPCCAGDLDEDGVDDFYVGDPNIGMLHAVSGATGSAIWVVSHGEGRFADGICRLPDVDGDGVSDLCANTTEEGSVLILSGVSGGVIGEIPCSSGAHCGGVKMMDASGDLTGDGVMDLLVGDPSDDVVRVYSFGVGTPEPSNQCVFLDGDGDGVFVPPHESLDTWDEYTMELWVERQAGSNRLIRAGDPYQQSIELTGDAADVYMHHNWSHNNQEGTDCGASSTGAPEWTHVAVTFADQVIRLYQNGELMYECGGMETPFEGMGYPLRIGHAFFFWNDNYLQGRIDEVRLWSYARSEQELRSTINKQIGASEAANYPGLVSSWGFEGNALDATGLNDAQLVGDAHFTDSTDIPVLFDCDQNGISDAEDIAADPSADCNLNGVLDVCEAVADSGVDCDGDGVLDVCQGAPDCNGNGVPDLCDIFNGSSADCNQNGIPDECELEGNDCNQNGWLDECDDLCFGQECPDCNENGIPDECELATGAAQDCNENWIPDICDIFYGDGFGFDCNGNWIPDECEFFDGTLTDLNNNGVADQCECPVVSYCTTSPNSVGDGVVLSTEGSACPDLNNLALVASGGPTGQPGLLFYGGTTASQPFGMGERCVGAPIYRLGTVFFGGAGDAVLHLDQSQGPMSSGSGEITPGSTWYFQLWYRDPASGSWGFNLSDGLAATFGS